MKNIIPIADLHYEEKLRRIDELELAEIVKLSREEKNRGKTLSHNEVKKRLNFLSELKRQKRQTD